MPTSPDSLLHLLVALAVVLAVGQALGRLCVRIGQPPVIGEVVGGILLGPSVLGHFAPGIAAGLFPAAITLHLSHIAQLGAVLYMFLVGVELEVDALRVRARQTLGIAAVGVIVPFLLGLVLAAWWYEEGAGAAAGRGSFALFLGVTLSITAFPVLARILADSGLQATALGRQALTCAAVDDVTAWCLLAIAIGVAESDVGRAVWTIVLTAAFVAAVLTVVSPIMARLARPDDGVVPTSRVAVVLLILLISSATTEWIGVHAIFGAFLAGMAVPSGTPLANALRGRLHDVVTALLLPAFFAVTGLRTQIGLLTGPREWLALVTVIVVASAGKIGGITLAARVAKASWRHALGLGVLMNTRGLMQLLVVSIGLDLGVFSRTSFTILALAAVVSTIGTAPGLHALGLWTPGHRTHPGAGSGSIDENAVGAIGRGGIV